MSTPFDQLREQAATKRNKAVQQARDEYRRTIQEIDAIERRIGEPRKKNRRDRIIFCISKCIEPGQPFSIGSVYAAMVEQFPERNAKRDHVKRCLLHLKANGMIKLVGRNESGGPIYVASSSC